MANPPETIEWLDTDEGQYWLNVTHTQITFPLAALKEVYGDRDCEFYPAVLWYCLDRYGCNPYADDDELWMNPGSDGYQPVLRDPVLAREYLSRRGIMP